MNDTSPQTPPPELDATLAPASRVVAKYGKAGIAGFQAVPDLLLKNQHKLGLTATDLVVLLNVLMHWWYPEQKPFPRSTTIAMRMGVTPRTVQRSLHQLEELGLLVRERKADGPTYLDPMPLVEKLSELAETDADYLTRSRRRDGEDGPGPHRPVSG